MHSRRTFSAVRRHCIVAGRGRSPSAGGVCEGDGRRNLKTIQYSASGWFSMIGQTYGLAEDWPHYEVTDYTRVIDFDAKFSREDYTRRQGKYPTLGRVPMPETHVTTVVNGKYAW